MDAALIELPAEAAPWTALVEPRSTHLFVDPDAPGFPAARRQSGLVAVRLDSDLARGLALACDAVLAHPLLAAHRQPFGWSAATYGGGRVLLIGPANVFFGYPVEDEGVARTLEVEHYWLAGLRRALEPWAEVTQPPA